MIVSAQHDFVFVHNPKCGGSLLRDMIGRAHDHPVRFWDVHHAGFFGVPLDHAHLRTWEMAALYPDVFARLRSGNSLVFVRDPKRRFLSALHQHCRSYRPAVAIDLLSPQEKIGVFRELVRSHITAERVTSDFRYVHFSPQRWFCMLGETRVVANIVPLGRRTNPLEYARNILEIDIDIDIGSWRHDVFENDDPLMADTVLHEFAQTFYRDDLELFASLPHVRSAFGA